MRELIILYASFVPVSTLAFPNTFFKHRMWVSFFLGHTVYVDLPSNCNSDNDQFDFSYNKFGTSNTFSENRDKNDETSFGTRMNMAQVYLNT